MNDTTTRDRGAELRNRVILPIVLPLAVLVGLALFVGAISLTLLYSSKTLAIVFAGVMAAGIMVAMSLAASVDEQDMNAAKRAVIVAAAAIPILASFGISLSNVSPDEGRFGERPIDLEPVALAPEGALVGAQNAESFCALEEVDGPCEDTQELTLPVQEEAPFSFQFNNQQANVPHNFQIFELADDGGPSAGDPIFTIAEGSATFAGPATQVYQVPEFVPEVDQQFYYNCVVHPVMQGVLTIVAAE